MSTTKVRTLQGTGKIRPPSQKSKKILFATHLGTSNHLLHLTSLYINKVAHPPRWSERSKLLHSRYRSRIPLTSLDSAMRNQTCSSLNFWEPLIATRVNGSFSTCFEHLAFWKLELYMDFHYTLTFSWSRIVCARSLSQHFSTLLNK